MATFYQQPDALASQHHQHSDPSMSTVTPSAGSLVAAGRAPSTTAGLKGAVSVAIPAAADHQQHRDLTSPTQQKNSMNVSRGISAYFKNLFKHGKAEEGQVGEEDADFAAATSFASISPPATSPAASAQQQQPHRATSHAKGHANISPFSIKSALPFVAGPGEGSVASGGSGPVHLKEFASKSFAPQSVAPGLLLGLGASGSSFSVQSSAKSSTAAIESEVAAAMRRAQSITGRQHAPSTLLAVNRDLPPKMNRPIWNLRDYAIIEKMYTGYASNVYKAFCKHSGETVCLKSYALGNLCELNRFQIFREVKLHSSLSHENVIKLYGAFQQADQVVLVQEFAESGDLFNLLQKYGGRLSERVAVELVMFPFLAVINYLHSNGIAHRDIKPENILFTGDMRLKLCDFGLAINMREERAVTRAGTLEYMAPEVLNCPFKNKPEENKENQELHYSFHVDTWAAGVLTYELLVGIPPFSDNHRNMVEDKIRLEMPRFPNKMSSLCQDFITRALEKDPRERPTVLDMLNHRWVRSLRRSASVRQLAPQGEQQQQQQQQQQLPVQSPQHQTQQVQQQHQQQQQQQQQLQLTAQFPYSGSLASSASAGMLQGPPSLMGSGKLGAGGLSSLQGQGSMVIREHEDEGVGSVASSRVTSGMASPASPAPPASAQFYMQPDGHGSGQGSFTGGGSPHAHHGQV